MQNTPNSLRPAQNEIHRTAHDQDLIEVPKRARLDREAEAKQNAEVVPVKGRSVNSSPGAGLNPPPEGQMHDMYLDPGCV
jgi:hypothetical protein